MKLWPLGLYRVAGPSMEPTYHQGDTLAGWHWFRPRAGQIVVARHTGRPLIKRIVKIEGDMVWLEGDNAAHSTDSRHFGAVPTRHLVAIIIARLG